MDQPRVILRLGLDGAERLYFTLATYAPEYLIRCGITSAVQFAVWAVGENASWVALDHGGLLLTDWRPGLVVRIHPIVWGKKLACDRDYIAEVLNWTRITCRVSRVETLVPMVLPRGVFKWCERAGMHFEGTLTKSTMLSGRIIDGYMYAITEAI